MLQRGIAKWDLVLFIINSIIGAGIFGLPSKIFALSGVYSLLAFGACALVVAIFILVFAEVSSRYEKTGGPYLYMMDAFGPFPAFLMGWMLLLSRLFNYATLINLLVVYLSFVSEIFQAPFVRAACIIGITTLLAGINYVGIHNTTRLSNVLTVAKLAPLALFILVGVFFLQGSNFNQAVPPTAANFSASVLLLIFAFGGFESVLVAAGEIKAPRKNLPFALLMATLIVTLFYCGIQLVSIGTLPTLATSDKPLAEAAQNFMGPWGSTLIIAGAFISITGTLHVLMLSGSRLPFALSQEGQLPQLFSRVHPQHATPVASLFLFMVLVAAASLAWSFMGALTIAVVIRLLMYMAVCAALLQLRRRKEPETFYKVRGGKVLALAGIVISIYLLTKTGWTELRDFLIVSAIGVVVYVLQKGFKTF